MRRPPGPRLLACCCFMRGSSLSMAFGPCLGVSAPLHVLHFAYSGAASHRHATHKYPGKPRMCCAEHAEPGMVSQGPVFGCTIQSVSPLCQQRTKTWPTPQCMLFLSSATFPWHDSRACAAPGSTLHRLARHSRTVDVVPSPPWARGCTRTASPGLSDRLLETPHAGGAGARGHAQPQMWQARRIR